MGKSLFALCACILLLSSCVGAGSGITVRSDGSGTLALEYRLAKDLESLGKLDGNERWLPVPAGRADLERTVNRVPGLALVSFSSKEDGKDIVYSARLNFNSPRALTAFLDASLEDVELDMERKRFVFTFLGAENPDGGFRDTVASSFSGYEFFLTLSMPAPVSVRWLDETGAEIQTPQTCLLKGSTVTFTSPMADIVLLDRTQVMEISW
ncbi:MAG: hypothetical protein LBI67_10665 [Treponema sp.]|nr:hypothetical protein [Treponema sp.]